MINFTKTLLYRLRKLYYKQFNKVYEVYVNIRTSIELGKIYKNIENKTAIIVGNGPSLKEIDLKTHKNINFYVCNYFYKHADYNSLNIIGYFMLDPFIENLNLSLQIEILKNALDNKRVKYFIIHASLYFKCEEVKNLAKKDNRVLPVFPNKILSIKFLKSKGIINFPKVQQTPIMALFVVIKNYKNVKLAGLDHTALREYASGNIYVEHFYSEEKAEMQLMRNQWYERVITTGKTFQQYLTFAQYAKESNITIVNLSKISDLQMFNGDDASN